MTLIPMYFFHTLKIYSTLYFCSLLSLYLSHFNSLHRSYKFLLHLMLSPIDHIVSIYKQKKKLLVNIFVTLLNLAAPKVRASILCYTHSSPCEENLALQLMH